MSKIGVEIARPISDDSLPVSRKAQREQLRDAQQSEQAAKSATNPNKSTMKRKRSDVDESDTKLKEFLEVMKPKSKSKTWNTEAVDNVQEPPTKMQAIEFPEAESDGDYEVVPKKSEQTKPVVEVLLSQVTERRSMPIEVGR